LQKSRGKKYEKVRGKGWRILPKKSGGGGNNNVKEKSKKKTFLLQILIKVRDERRGEARGRIGSSPSWSGQSGGIKSSRKSKNKKNQKTKGVPVKGPSQEGTYPINPLKKHHMSQPGKEKKKTEANHRLQRERDCKTPKGMLKENRS